MASPPRTPPPPPGAERRRAQRVTLMAQVEVRRSEEVVVLPVGNLSDSGIFLGVDRLDLARRAFASGETVNVFLAYDDDLVLSIDAQVVRVEAGSGGKGAGIGLRWSSKDPAALATLRRLLDKLATAG